MIRVIKKRITISSELRSKIEWACTFSGTVPKILSGSLRIVEHTNLAYVEPHRVIINNTLYLFYNEHDYFYKDNLMNKYPISQLREIINGKTDI